MSRNKEKSLISLQTPLFLQKQKWEFLCCSLYRLDNMAITFKLLDYLCITKKFYVVEQIIHTQHTNICFTLDISAALPCTYLPNTVTVAPSTPCTSSLPLPHFVQLCPRNEHPYISQFIQVKVGFAGICIFSLFVPLSI